MPTAPSSATGGFLSPLPEPAPLEGQELNRFIQQMVVGITGLDGKFVRPAWQAEPPNIPPAGKAWAAIRIATVPGDTFSFVGHLAGDEGTNELQRQEQLNILASFYDLGTDGLADHYVSLLRDGLAISQNREYLTSAGMGLNSVGAEVSVPVLLKERWLYRVDLPFIISRQVTRRYAVRNVLSAEGVLITSDGERFPFVAEPQS